MDIWLAVVMAVQKRLKYRIKIYQFSCYEHVYELEEINPIRTKSNTKYTFDFRPGSSESAVAIGGYFWEYDHMCENRQYLIKNGFISCYG